MKNYPHCIILLFLVFASGLAPAALAQGTFTPPSGAPAPTMKSLDQVEARTIVNATNTPGDATNTFIIRAPGSYYLTENLTGAVGKHGISIQANGVSLDLNGFALISGGSGTVRGINVPVAQSNLSIRNGNVQGWSDGGVRADTAVTFAEKLMLATNTGASGLAVGNGSLVKDCVAWGNGTGFSGGDRTQFSICISTENTDDGFSCTSFVTLTDCTSSRNGGIGIGIGGNGLVSRCGTSRNGRYGISTGGGTMLTECTASSNTLDGIVAWGCKVTNSSANNNLRDGMNVSLGGNVSHCTANGNGANGILAIQSCVTNSTADGNHSYGIDGSFGLISFCMARKNGDANFSSLSATVLANKDGG